MNKLNPKPIDIINAAIAEIYGKQAVDLLKLFSKLNDEGKSLTVEYAEMSANSDRYKKAIMLRMSDNH